MMAVSGLVGSGVTATKVAVAGLPLVMVTPLAVAVKVTVPDFVFVIVIWYSPPPRSTTPLTTAVACAEPPVGV